MAPKGAPSALDSKLLALAERLVEKSLARKARAAEVFATVSRGAGLSIERGTLSNGSSASELGIAVRVIDAKRRVGFAFATSEEHAERAIGTALDAARVLPASRKLELPGRQRYAPIAKLHDARVASLDVAEAARACDAMMRAAKARAPKATVAGGGVAWGEERVAIANSEGAAGEYRGTFLAGSLSVVQRDAVTTTGFESAVSRRWDVDWATIGREAADLALRSRKPIALPSGETTVLFKPNAFDGLLEPLVLRAAMAENANAGRSVYSGKLGEDVMPRAFGLVDDGRLAGGARSAPFDDEGLATRTTPIVEKGRLKTFLDDVAGAAERGGKPTASALRAGRIEGRTFRAPPRTTGLNVRFTGPSKKLEDLVAGVERGVLVHDAMGAHTANPASGDFSVNSTILFEIRDGEIGRAGKPAMISGNLPKALAVLGGMGKDARDVGGGAFSPASFRLPTVRLDGIRVTAA